MYVPSRAVPLLCLLLLTCCTVTQAAVWAWDFATEINRVPPVTSGALANTSAETSSLNELDEQQDCRQQIGVVENGVVNRTAREYDVKAILTVLGGAPGKVNVTRVDSPAELQLNATKERPLPDSQNQTYWLYSYSASDFTTFLRQEHALLRFPGTPHEFVDVRGDLWWTPPDFCGHARHVTYRQDDTGFHSDLLLEYCRLREPGHMSCASPAYCGSNATSSWCVG